MFLLSSYYVVIIILLNCLLYCQLYCLLNCQLYCLLYCLPIVLPIELSIVEQGLAAKRCSTFSEAQTRWAQWGQYDRQYKRQYNRQCNKQYNRQFNRQYIYIWIRAVPWTAVCHKNLHFYETKYPCSWMEQKMFKSLFVLLFLFFDNWKKLFWIK